MKEAKSKSQQDVTQNNGGLARVVLCRDPAKNLHFSSSWGQGFYDFSKPISVLAGARRTSRSVGQFDQDCYLLDDVHDFLD